MYDWLSDALGERSSLVVTANRRLARTLTAHVAAERIAAGRSAWRRPAIVSWPEWIALLSAEEAPATDFPLRIGGQQSLVLWERCLRRDLDEALLNIGGLARLCRDTWLRLHEWRVPLEEFQNRAAGQDQRIFARAAGHYDAELRDRGMIDDAQLPSLLAERIAAAGHDLPATLWLAGFDRLTPQAVHLTSRIVELGGQVHRPEPQRTSSAAIVRLDNADAELRAAGHWAREQLRRQPAKRVAIVVTDLERDAERSTRLIREGFVPGWQYADEQARAALNVSYGRRLSEYPAIAAALRLLRWFFEPQRSSDVSYLLRSPFFGDAAGHGRARLETALRDWPDQQWTPVSLERALRARADRDDAADWLARLGRAGEALGPGPTRRRLSQWAERFDEVLGIMQWPGTGTFSSGDYQLVDRWRELLNDVARLDLVSPALPGADAQARCRTMAADAVFQPESQGALVSVIGPLEAAGAEYDCLWVSGATSENWPAASSPLALVSRELQRDYGMPDATPDDTAAYAARVLGRLRSSADEVVFSYPAVVGDAEQLPATLLDDVARRDPGSLAIEDPGWHAGKLTARVGIRDEPDRVPELRTGERIAGGAATIDRQTRDPFAAFAFGRLGIRRLAPIGTGLAANVRGSLVHDALHHLYRDRPTAETIAAWRDSGAEERVSAAVDAAFRAPLARADETLRQLLQLEQQRCRAVLHAVVDFDARRGAFVIAGVEERIDAGIEGAAVRLRCDRVERAPDGSLAIVDYKTGAARTFLVSGEPDDLQLVVYACAVNAPVGGLAFFNLGSREAVIAGAGPAFDNPDDWQTRLGNWRDEVRGAAAAIVAGDVRLNVLQSHREARPLSLLSRFAELRRER
ncbi:MAG: PD-(D/E)XK nuclease family protein [Woeseiaceae bacterium]|nr:PD-(D/E)XK nuclease family protein [Woeseiaceae bacterium]